MRLDRDSRRGLESSSRTRPESSISGVEPAFPFGFISGINLESVATVSFAKIPERFYSDALESFVLQSSESEAFVAGISRSFRSIIRI